MRTTRIWMTQYRTLLLFAIVAGLSLLGGSLSGLWARDFLTDQEVEMMQNVQSIDKRTGIYMEAASLRLVTAQDRFDGKESTPGDALEF
ncbi:MAG: hypothetical protein LBP68_01020, partial [Acidobacteriota bacterium]|nr:hypothetical protein [Acidobacteriota bacterium]